MDLSKLIPVEREVDVLDPRTKEPTGLKLVIAHESDPRVIAAQRKAYDEAITQDGKTDEEVNIARNRKLQAAQVVDWKWTGDANFNGKKPAFAPETLSQVAAIPVVGSAIFRAISDEAGFYKG